MENKYIFLMAIIIIALFAYSTAESITENKVTCERAEDCSIVETSCCSGERAYACYENNYALLLKTQNLKCPYTSNGTCSAEYKAPPDCECVQKKCAAKEKNETAFKEQLKNLSYAPPEQGQWGS